MNFEYMKNFMDRLCEWRIPGNSVCVCHDGKEIFRYSSGYSDLENGIKMNGGELLNIYSTSKVCTVTAALQLYEKGFFLLDDPVYDFIPEFRTLFVKDNSGEIKKAEKVMTIRQLFTMTSGLSYNTGSPAFEKAKEITDGKMNTLEVIKCLAQDPLAFEPGEKWNYSLSHDVLAAVVEVVSGMKFRDYVRKNIFEPLEMNDTFYHNENVRDRMAQQYQFINSENDDIVEAQKTASRQGGTLINVGKRNSLVFGDEYDSGGAGIVTTVSDYAKFAQALALKGKGMNRERILSEGTVELLRANQLNDNQMKYFDWDVARGYGYGLGVKTMMSRALSGSTGSVGAFSWGGAAGASIFVDPDEKLSLFYAHHMLNPQEGYYQPRLRNVLYTCFKG